MNIAVINIRDLIKVVLVLCLVAIVIITGINIIKVKEESKDAETLGKQTNSSFLLCLNLELPSLVNDEKEQNNTLSSNNTTTTQKILDTQIAMLYNIDTNTEDKQVMEENVKNVAEEKKEEQPEDKTIDGSQDLEIRVIEENNITPSFTDSNETIQVKNQSKYDINDLIANANYQIKNKDKVVIYHTHTCESYTPSEKYNYEMTGAYRTTDLNYTVSRVRRRVRRMLETVRKKCSA